MRYALLVLIYGTSAAFGDFTVSRGSLPLVAMPSSSGNGFVVGRGELPNSLEASRALPKPVIKMYTATWCYWCREAKSKLTPGVVADLGFELVLVDTDRSNEYSGPIPAFRWETPSGVKTITGWPGVNGLRQNWQNSVLVSPKPKAMAHPPLNSNVVSQNSRLTSEQLRTFARSYRGYPYGVNDGNFWGHLQSRNHGFEVWQLNGLTQAECAAIHAGHHWGYLTPFHINK